MSPSHARLVAALAAAAGLAACNALTGADEIAIRYDKHKHGSSSGEGAGSSSSSSGSGLVGPGGSSTSSSGAGAGPEMVYADGVRIDALALYQGVKRPLIQNGGPAASDVPVVANRNALLRVFYSPIDGGNGQPVTARLTLGDKQHEATGSLGSGSSDASLGSTLNVLVPAESLPGFTSYRVELLQPSGVASGNNQLAAYPAQGKQDVAVQSSGQQLKIVLVPIAYNADGSGRLPATGESQLKLYHDEFYGIYPTPAVVLTVHQAVGWDQAIQPNGAGWGELLDAMVSFRQSDGAKPDEYYYGIFSPAPSMAAFCGGGCVAGLSMMAGPNDAFARVGIGLGFPGESSAESAAHETGHMHGLGHAPCGGPQGVDPNYPYAGGKLGSFGYDLVDGKLYSPSTTYDLMTYCQPVWISDYHFVKLFQRIKLVNGALVQWPADAFDRTYERIRIGMDGTAHWEAPIALHTPPLGAGGATPVSAETDAGPVEVPGHFFPFTHIAGGLLLFAQPGAAPSAVSFELAGQQHELAR
ncbi:MAG: hypothetical protein HY744_34340 [Deltaproteobacteria bacterium]|nr:hypothetical protein [Deltaproteobacteria bacterium]